MRDAVIEKQGLSVAEASHVAGIGRTKLYEAIGAGQLTVRKFGKRTIVLREDLARFLVALPMTNVEIKPASAPVGRSSQRRRQLPIKRTTAKRTG